MSGEPSRGVADVLAQTDAWREGVSHTARSKDQKDAIHRYTVEQAIKYGFLGLVVGLGGNMLLSRFSPFWQRLYRTPKWIITISGPVIGFSLGGELSALDLERRLASRKSVVDLHALQLPLPDLPPPDVHRGPFSWLPASSDIKGYILDNRYKVVGMGWLTVSSLTLVSLWSNRNMPVSQKLIHARMYAQGTALAAFAAFALVSNVPVDRSSETDKQSEQYFRAVMEGRNVSGRDHTPRLSMELASRRTGGKEEGAPVVVEGK